MIELKVPKDLGDETSDLLSHSQIKFTPLILKSASAPAVFQIISLAIKDVTSLVTIFDVLRSRVNDNVQATSPLDEALDQIGELFGSQVQDVTVTLEDGRTIPLRTTSSEQLRNILLNQRSTTEKNVD